MYKVKQFFRNIHNLIRWFPIIWKDRDWDDHFIFEILKFKLKNQAKYIGNKDRHVSAKRDAEKMMLCVRLIEKVQDEYYGTEYFDYHESKLNFIDSKSHPGMYEMEVDYTSEHFNDYFKKYPRIYNQVKTEDKHKTAFNIACINEERAHKLLFKILEQNIRRWWD
jgi:Fe-S cluster assembly iron-binding protein IscA